MVQCGTQKQGGVGFLVAWIKEEFQEHGTLSLDGFLKSNKTEMIPNHIRI